MQYNSEQQRLWRPENAVAAKDWRRSTENSAWRTPTKGRRQPSVPATKPTGPENFHWQSGQYNQKRKPNLKVKKNSFGFTQKPLDVIKVPRLFF